MSKHLAHLEARMEALLEGTLARWMGGRLRPRDLAVALALALEDSITHGMPATRYVLRLHPADAQALLGDQPRLADRLAGELLLAAQEAAITLPQLPEIIIRPDPGLKRGAAVVAPEENSQPVSVTQAMTAAGEAAAPVGPPAFLILDGQRTMPLTQPVISIGRRLDNHIIIDDARVSRAHVQLRLRFGRYVLYDLGSSGGTFVNGQRVDEYILRPGDVISLSGVSLIYGEDEIASAGSDRPASDTQPSRPTAPTPARGRPSS